jgi:ferric-dicitrate binding protein FerR (iron transport regulator)
VKKLSVLLTFAALFLANFAFAQTAVATAVTGTAQMQTGTASPRSLRVGDEVRQGDTISTSTSSSVVLKFDDGQVAALTANSRMTITAYQFNPQARTGNVLLSLINGGMRAITGLIGRNQPERVAYRAATATIGIRGTDVTIVTNGSDVAVTVAEGSVTFTYGGKTIVIPAGQGVLLQNGQISPGTIQQIFSQLRPELQVLIGGIGGLTNAINQAAPGTPRGGADTGGIASGTTPGSVPPGGTGGGGGGAPSVQ